jgi:hypothetical protein
MNKKILRGILGTLMTASFATAAHAQQPDSEFHFLLSGGLTAGGDNMATVQYTNGDKASLHAGGLVNFGLGVLWQSGDMPVAVSGTVNYQVDRANGSNGDVRFSRVPVEILAYYTGVEKWRMGGGVRRIGSPKFTYDVSSTKWSTSFDASTGIVLEAGYNVSENGWLNFRLVSERFKPKSYTSGSVTVPLSGAEKVDGSHFGINFLYQF